MFVPSGWTFLNDSLNTMITMALNLPGGRVLLRVSHHQSAYPPVLHEVSNCRVVQDKDDCYCIGKLEEVKQ